MLVSTYSLTTGTASHHFQNHPAAQAEAVLEQQTLSHNLIFSDTISILGKQFLLLIGHGSKQLFLIPADQLQQLFVLLTGRSVLTKSENDCLARNYLTSTLIFLPIFHKSQELIYNQFLAFSFRKISESGEYTSN